MSYSGIYYWGPCAWNYLHNASYAYPHTPTEEDKYDMHQFLLYFTKVIPCKACRDDFTSYLQRVVSKGTRSKMFSSKTAMVRFSVDAHNYVNQKLGKRIFSYEEVDDLYLRPQSNHALVLLLTIVLVALLVTYLTAFHKKTGEKKCLLSVNGRLA